MKTSSLEIGEVRGRLTLVAKADPIKDRPRRTHTYWTFRCSCGTIKAFRVSRVVSGNTKSCGCLRVDRLKLPRPHRRVSDAAAKQTWSGYGRNAKSRSLSFELSFDEFFTLSQKNCHYCGVEPSNFSKCKSHYKKEFTYNGIDRVDNSLGYVLENCVPCCKICNSAKSNLTEGQFQQWIDRLVAFQYPTT